MIEKNRTGGFILSEGNGNISREEITIKSGAGVLQAGQVLGNLTVGGKFSVYNNAATDGTQTATAILYSEIDATTADAKAVVIVRAAEVKANQLIAIDAASIVELATNQIIVR